MAYSGPTHSVARQRHNAEEEEILTPYQQDDLSDDWESKIVRATLPVFGNPTIFQQVVDAEAQNGWILLEKFDDQRVRFKRRQRIHENDDQTTMGIDPYQTQFRPTYRYGFSPFSLGLAIAILVVFLLFIVLPKLL